MYNREMAIRSLQEIRQIFLRNELFSIIIGEENSVALSKAYDVVEKVLNDLEGKELESLYFRVHFLNKEK